MSKSTAARLIFLMLLLFFVPFYALTDLDLLETSGLASQQEVSGHVTTGTDSASDTTGQSHMVENPPLVQVENTGASDLTGIDAPDPSQFPNGEPLTGETFHPSAQLVVSEVFFDGSDERFEVANIGSGAFSGALTIKGVKSSDLHVPAIVMPAGSVYVRGDTIAEVADRTFIKGTSLGLSISDSAALAVLLYSSSGLLLDSMLADSSLISSLPNDYGIEKAWSGASLTILPTATSRVVSVSGSRIANPGVIRTLTQTASPPEESPDVPSFTGSDTPSEPSGSGTGVISDILSLTEIHPGNDLLPEYIELFFHRTFHGDLRIAGLGSSVAVKDITVTAYTGQYLVITDSLSGFADTSPLQLIDTVSLTDGGELLTISDFSGNIYAAAQYTGTKSGQSRYADTGDMFTISLPVTPGFSVKALHYFGVANNASTQPSSAESDTYYQGLYKKRKDRYYDLKSQILAFGLGVNKGGFAYRKSGSDVPELVDGSEEFGDISAPSTNFHIAISAILPDADGKDENSEQVTIVLLSGGSADLSVIDLQSGKKNVRLQGMLASPGDELTLKGNFNLPNKPSCVTLRHGEMTYDTFCYGQPKAGIWIGLTGNILADGSLSGTNDVSRMKELRLSLLTGQACVFFGDVSFDCITVKSMLDEKTKAKYDKKVASLQEKYAKKQRQYTGQVERYKTMKTSLDAKRKKYYNQVKTVRNDYKEKLAVSSLEMRIRKDYGSLLQKDLKDKRYIVRQHSDIALIQNLLEKNLAALKENDESTTLTMHGQTFSVGELKRQYAFIADPAAILDNRVAQGLHILSPSAGTQRTQRLDIRYETDK